MKKIIYVFLALTLGMFISGCGKGYDDTELKGKVDQLTEEVNTIKANQKALQAVIDVWKTGGYVQSIDDSVPGQHTITFYGENGKSVIIYDGVDGEDGSEGPQGPQGPGGESGDTFFKSVVTTEDGVTFTLSDDTSFTIPFAKAFQLVIENPEANVEAGVPVEFPYTVKGANASTTVDVFASGNYSAEVNAEASKIVVIPPTPAVNGNVLAWAQNNEGLVSLVKLKFMVTAEAEIVTDPEVYQAIPMAGGEIVLDVVSNVDIIVPSPNVDWVTVSLTKASYKLTLTVAENTTGEPRELDLKILRADNNEQVQEFKIIQLATAPASKETKIERVWGKYSTSDASWNNYYGGAAGGERNVTLDEEYVYIPETGTKKLWAISIADPEQVKAVNVSSVLDEGTFKISCPRVLKNTDSSLNGGKDILVVSNMTEGDPYLYFYINGIDEAPSVVKANTWASRRLGDTFTFGGTLQDGVFFFKDFNSAQGTVTFPVKLQSNTSALFLSARLVAPAVTGAGAYFPYPDDMANGVCSVRGGGPAQSVATTANFLTAEGAITPTLTDLSGYYTDAAFRFFEFNGKKYIAYTRQVDSTDGRLFVIEGESTDTWSTILSTRKVVYHAAIQNSTEGNEAPGDPSPKASGNSGMDLDIHEINGSIYIAVVKQNVGLSLFRVFAE